MTITVGTTALTFNDSTVQNTAFTSTTGVTAGTYGSTANSITITIGADGRVTAIANATIVTASPPAFSAFDGGPDGDS